LCLELIALQPKTIEMGEPICISKYPPEVAHRLHDIAAILATGLARLGHLAKPLPNPPKLLAETSPGPLEHAQKPSVTVRVG
jgi:hypothetical protein